ncbi:MAG: AI-2E family transporter, partial [Treponema sp.]|nr:AI-2E family transporter [Treponema sp.]
PEWGLVLFIGIATVSINMILGNIIEPRWEGSDLGISPFIILVSLSFWGWMWGFLGMILAVPLMVIIKIVCENIELLQPFAVIIGTNKSHRRKKKEED